MTEGFPFFCTQSYQSNRFTSPGIFWSFSGDKALRFACLSRFRFPGLLHSWQNGQFSTVQSCLFLQIAMEWRHRKVFRSFSSGPSLSASGISSALPFCTSPSGIFGSTLFVEVATAFAKHKVQSTIPLCSDLCCCLLLFSILCSEILGKSVILKRSSHSTEPTHDLLAATPATLTSATTTHKVTQVNC